ELKPPVQKGWKRTFVLRSDVAKSHNADFFQNIPDKINTQTWSSRKDYLNKKRRKEKGKKVYVIKPQKLQELNEYNFMKLGLNDKEKKFFREEEHLNHSKYVYKKFIFNEPWRFTLKVMPNMIDKIRTIDAKITKRKQE